MKMIRPVAIGLISGTILGLLVRQLPLAIASAVIIAFAIIALVWVGQGLSDMKHQRRKAEEMLAHLRALYERSNQ